MQVLGIVAAVLVAMGSKTDYATGFLDLVVYIMEQGCVTPALTMVSNWASSGSADPMLVRHFIFKSLAVCAPPYSAYFTSILLRLGQQLLSSVYQGVAQVGSVTFGQQLTILLGACCIHSSC